MPEVTGGERSRVDIPIQSFLAEWSTASPPCTLLSFAAEAPGLSISFFAVPGEALQDATTWQQTTVSSTTTKVANQN